MTGDDLIAAGHVPGPKFREILHAIEDAQLEGRLASRDAALEFVRNEFPMTIGERPFFNNFKMLGSLPDLIQRDRSRLELAVRVWKKLSRDRCGRCRPDRPR